MKIMNQKPCLLIVDDEPLLIEVLVQQLDSGDIEILTAENGVDAFEIIHTRGTEKPVHAILSDINMPKMNGLELLTKLRAEHLNIPTVFLSAYGDKKNLVTALRLGAFDFLEKPYGLEALNDTVDRALFLGLSMTQLEPAVDQVMSNYPMSEDSKSDTREKIKAVLTMKIENRTFFNKK